MKRITITPRTRTGLITLGAFALLAILLLLGRAAGSGRLTAQSAADTADRVALLKSGGWEVDPASERHQTIHIPETFSDVYESYNELQRLQGYDLANYKGMDCELYTYTVTNYPDETQNVLANIYICKNRVIGGDVHSTSLNGFMLGIK